MPSSEPIEIPDLRALLAEASRPSATVTVPIKQGLREQIEAAEAELEALAESGGTKRMGAKSPLSVAAQKVRALEAEMAASALTFTFEALTHSERDQIRQDMRGRDNPDEMNLRAVAAMCRKVTGPDGAVYADTMTWEDFSALRDAIGVHTFALTVDAAADRAAGGQWSVPFSRSASHILETAT